MAGVIFQKTLENWFPSLRATIVVIARKKSALSLDQSRLENAL
jgi:hypothetical protein